MGSVSRTTRNWVVSRSETRDRRSPLVRLPSLLRTCRKSRARTLRPKRAWERPLQDDEEFFLVQWSRRRAPAVFVSVVEIVCTTPQWFDLEAPWKERPALAEKRGDFYHDRQRTKGTNVCEKKKDRCGARISNCFR